ncbi:hypothetical protein JCM14719A_08270 [Calditerricola satsumensis]|uniref:Uncharacterized protein n=1 Tax=Calditerricola satsumensis TaxID=373054 RepID=A0A8J3FAU7_9BACI|nr:hypothetical protein GCM10007043_15360 [Calditerricola satsumensis]
MPQHAKGAFPEAPHPRLAHVIAQVERVVIGKRAAVETVLVAVLGGGARARGRRARRGKDGVGPRPGEGVGLFLCPHSVYAGPAAL